MNYCFQSMPHRRNHCKLVFSVISCCHGRFVYHWLSLSLKYASTLAKSYIYTYLSIHLFTLLYVLKIKIKTLNYNTPPLSCRGQITLSIIKKSLVKIPWYLLVIVRETKIWAYLGQITPSDFDKIFSLAIQNQISTISMHIPSLVKNHWCLIKLSSGNENMGVSRADNSVKLWRNLPISNPKSDLHKINAHTKFGENALMFTQVIIRKRKTDGQTDVRLTDGDGRTDTRTSNVKPP